MIRTRKTVFCIVFGALAALCFIAGALLWTPAPDASFATETAHDHSTWTVWGGEESEKTALPTAAGSYVLYSDITLSSTWAVPEGTTNLCLNGHVVYKLSEAKYSDYVIRIGANATLNLYDCDTSSRHYFKDDAEMEGAWIYDKTLTEEDAKHTVIGGLITSEESVGIKIDYQGVLNMYGGSVSGNHLSDGTGSGVHISGGTFNLYGGAISGNYNDMTTGGIGIDAYITHSGEEADNIYAGTFNMHGGKIEYNVGAGQMSSGAVELVNSVFNMYGGEISNNVSNMFAGGVYVYDNAVFSMYDGKITQNQGVFGGGVSLLFGVESVYELDTVKGTSTFVMHGGEISHNSAVSMIMYDMYETGGVGGGVLVTTGTTFKADGGSITENTAEIAGAGVYSVSGGLKEWLAFSEGESGKDPYFCVGEGTPVTLSDGTQKNVEELSVGDVLRVFDHETGSLSSSKIFYLEKSENVVKDVFRLRFENGIYVTVISGHCFFNQEENKYVNLTLDNVGDYVGKRFYNADAGLYEELLGYEAVTTGVDSYSVVTEKTLNFFTDGMLSAGDAIYYVLINTFSFGDGLRYDAEQRQADIEKYGLWEYVEAKYVTQATYDALNLKYIKVAIGKGLITPEQFLGAGDYQKGRGNDLVRQSTSGIAFTVKRLSTEQPSDDEAAGIYFGGTIQIVDNRTEDDRVSNVLIGASELSQKITLGTGTDTQNGENGVKKPQSGMAVGITFMLVQEAFIEGETYVPGSLAYGEGQFTTNGTVGETPYFFADNESYGVFFNDNGTTADLTDDFFEVKLVGTSEEVCFHHWILLALLVIGAALFGLLHILWKADAAAVIASLIGLAASVAIMVLGTCTTCTVVAILDIAVFALEILCVLLENHDRKEKPKK